MAWCEVEWQGLLHTGQDRIEQRAQSIGHGGWSHHTHMHIYCTVQGQGVCFGYFSSVVKPYMNIYGLMFACGIPFQVGYLGMQCNAMQRNFLKRFSFRSYMGNGKCGQNSRTTYNTQTDRSVSNYDGCSRCVSRAHPYVSAWLSRFTCSYTSIYQGSTIS